MALILEDGTGVVGANTYITVEEARAYTAARGVILPTEDAEVEPMLVNAADYTELFSDKYKGKRNTSTQGLSWPRTGVILDETAFPDDKIPTRLKSAQAQGVLDIANGATLSPNITGYAIRKMKADVVEIEYAAGGSVNQSSTPEITPEFPKIDNWLKPLFRNMIGLLSVVRA